MCEDMNILLIHVGDNGDSEDISIGTVERKIVERILMELYCCLDMSDLFKELPNKNDVILIITINYW